MAEASPPAATADSSAGHDVFTAVLPLCLGEGRVYPAYIHVARDRESAGARREDEERETWMRVCLATDNIGVVDTVFHLRGRRQLAIRVGFTDREAADELRRHLPEIRARLAASALTLTDLSVVALPAKEQS